MSPSHPLLQFGAPPDGVAWGTLLLGAALTALTALPRPRARVRRLLLAHPRVLLAALALGAVALSGAYVDYYLRGGPRIIDATAYYLQARAFLEGGPSFEVPTPSAAFRGRFLVPTPAADPATPALGVLFPPGYPAVLAAGFAWGRPLWVGPLLGGALVFTTYGLALRLSGRRGVGLLAAALSVVSAALRYHTADTMSHGLAALLFTAALWASLAPRGAAGRDSMWPRTLLGGFCVGWLFATRPLTGMVCAAACGWLLLGPLLRPPYTPASTARRGLGRIGPFALATLPGLGLLFWQQLELTGDPLGSVQVRYYALADGPPGCFGLGVGPRFGCHHEHGDVVARFGEAGFTPLWAVRHTLHRFHHHALDFANWEPAWLLVPWALWRLRKRRYVNVLTLAALGVVVAYGAFYFPGNYPGGGARFFVELLPLEHAVVAWATLGAWTGRWLLPVALLGFGCHGSYSHRDLSEREGGRPMYEPAVVSRSLGGARDGALLFVDTDHGFNLGHDPALGRRLAATNAHAHPAEPAPDAAADPRRLARGEVLVARATNPDLDRLLWERLGRPPAYAYRLRWAPGGDQDDGPGGSATPELVPLPWSQQDPTVHDPAGNAPTVHAPAPEPAALQPARGAATAPPSHGDGVPSPFAPLRAEAEHDWPPLAVEDGWSQLSFPPAACASGGRALAFHATGPSSRLGGELNVPLPGPHRLVLGFVRVPRPAGSAQPGARTTTSPSRRARLLVDGRALSFELPPPLPGGSSPGGSSSEAPQGHSPARDSSQCARVELPPLPLATTSRWTLESNGHSLMLDYLEILPTPPDEF